MDIGLITQDLVDRVKSVASFTGRVGLALGGQEHDPMNRELTQPFAWVVFIGDDVVDTTFNACLETIKLNFVVKVVIDYDTEQSLVTTHFPLLYEVVTTVKGNEPANVGKNWLYEGQTMEALDADRMVWAQRYSFVVAV